MTVSLDELPDTPELRVHRYRELQRRNRSDLHAILDAGTIAHIGFVRPDGKPMVIPMAYVRDGEFLLMHGSSGAGLTKSATAGVDLVATISIFDGLVYAQSLFDSTVNYRCAVVFGTALAVPAEEREDCVRKISEHLMPGRWTEVRPPTKRELAATYVLRLSLDSASVKAREGHPDEAPEPGIWTGYVPFDTGIGQPVTQPGVEAERPESLKRSAAAWSRRLARP
jgi:uncharacterized protein